MTIEVVQVGVHFACVGIVRSVATRRILHATRNYPVGMEHLAYSAAEGIAERTGREVVSEVAS